MCPRRCSSSTRSTSPLAGSTTGVDVTPRTGLMSSQPSLLASTGTPSVRDQRTAPVDGSSAATTSASVATIRLPAATTGWA